MINTDLEISIGTRKIRYFNDEITNPYNIHFTLSFNSWGFGVALFLPPRIWYKKWERGISLKFICLWIWIYKPTRIE